MLMNKRFVPLVLALLLASAGGKLTAAADDKLQFNRDVRPILVEN